MYYENYHHMSYGNSVVMKNNIGWMSMPHPKIYWNNWLSKFGPRMNYMMMMSLGMNIGAIY